MKRTRDLVERGGGTWEGQDVWGRRKLAYEIDKKARRRLPPAVVHGRGRDAGRDLARAQDRRQRDAPPGDPSLQAGFHSAGSGGRSRARGCPSSPSTPRWRRSNAPERQQRHAHRQPDHAIPSFGTRRPGRRSRTLRIAVNDRVKRGEEWTDAAYYFDVTVWGRQAENCAQYLAKGRPVGVDGQAHVARVGRPGRHQAPGGRGRRRHHPVPRRSR